MALERKPRLLVIGSVMVDTIIDARSIEAKQLIDLKGRFYLSFERAVGGVALNAAVYGQQIGFQTSLIAKIGGERSSESGKLVPDAIGQQILNYLESHAIQPALSLDLELETGEVILMHFDDSIRMAISSEGANSNIKMADCSREKITQLNPDALVIDGYIMSHSEGKSIVLHLIQLAQSLSCLSILDLLPHNLYEYMSFDELEMTISGLDILQIQSRTLRGFLNSSYEGTFSIEEFNWYIDKLSKHHKWLIIEDEENVFVGGIDEPSHQLHTDIFSHDLKMQRGFMSKIVLNWVYHRFLDKE